MNICAKGWGRSTDGSVRAWTGYQSFFEVEPLMDFCVYCARQQDPGSSSLEEPSTSQALFQSGTESYMVSW